jgi:hypothetical protein
MRKVLGGLSLVFLLSACATYTENGLFGGYHEVPLAADTYRISSKGNDLTTRSKTNAIALVRAADLAIEHGYTRLEISNYNEWTKTKSFELPSSSTTYFHMNSYTGTGYATTYQSPRNTITEEHPRTDLVVRFVALSASRAVNALSVNQLILKYGPIAGLSQVRIDEMLSEATFIEAKHAATKPLAVTNESSPKRIRIQTASNPMPGATQAAPNKPTKEPTLDDLYGRLREDEKFIADTLPPAERAQYIYSKKR